MQRYIEQVINDLRQAKKNVPPEPDFGETYKEFEKTMWEIENAPDIDVKKTFGVSFEELPPPEKLTVKQMQQLIDAIEDTWNAFRISVELPCDIPVKLKYELFRDEFDEENNPIPGYANVFSFCDGWCPGCKLAEYCPSRREIWNDDEFEEARREEHNSGDET